MLLKDETVILAFTPIISASSTSGPYLSITLLPLLTLSPLITLTISLSEQHLASSHNQNKSIHTLEP